MSSHPSTPTARLLAVLLSTLTPVLPAVSDPLDFELPDAWLDSSWRIKENGKTYTREAYQDAQARAEIVETQSRDGARS